MILESMSSLGNDGTRIRGLTSVAYILLGYIFDNREMAEREKPDIRKVSKYPENDAPERNEVPLLYHSWARSDPEGEFVDDSTGGFGYL